MVGNTHDPSHCNMQPDYRRNRRSNGPHANRSALNVCARIVGVRSDIIVQVHAPSNEDVQPRTRHSDTNAGDYQYQPETRSIQNWEQHPAQSMLRAKVVFSGAFRCFFAQPVCSSEVSSIIHRLLFKCCYLSCSRLDTRPSSQLNALRPSTGRGHRPTRILPRRVAFASCSPMDLPKSLPQNL